MTTLPLPMTTAPMTRARATPMRGDEHGAGPAAHPAPPSVADHEAVALEDAEARVRHRIVAAQAVLHGRQLECLAQFAERLARTPNVDLRSRRAPQCSRCHKPGHVCTKCTAQLEIEGSRT